MIMERRRPLITAHAGCMGTIPNSRESFVAAFSSMADIIEADIRSTRDGIPVLTHDDSFSINDSAPIKVGSLDWGELLALVDCGQAEGIMRLETYLDLAAELDNSIRGGGPSILNLDIKESASLGAVAGIVRNRGLGSTVLFSGIKVDGLPEARIALSGLRYLFNADASLIAAEGLEADCRKVCAIASEFGCAGINLEWTNASARFMSFAREAGFPVMLWTVDRAEDMRTALAFEPDSITTNRPDILARLIPRRRRAP